MRAVKFLAGLLVAAMVHVLGVRLFDGFSSAIDVFLVVALFNALGGSPLAGLLGGLVTGWCADAMTGGLYGTYGFCNTLVGYGAAVAAQRLVIEKTSGVFLLFSLGAAVQQLLLVALSRLLRPGAAPPELTWLMVMFATVGLTGAVGFMLQGRALRWRNTWRRNRAARLR
ncbi:MAG: rod shape-determining protein MreD [bacterium]|nr:rod shape-determining protein MreD [bacterium]